MRLPDEVVRLVASVVSAPIEASWRVGGGSINEAAAVDAGGLRLFVKWHHQAPAGFFDAEADGLRRLAATGLVRTPEVLALHEGRTSVLVMRRLPTGGASEAAMTDAGRRLAMLHARSPRASRPGLERDNFMGALPQDNRPASDDRWVTFFRERRLGALSPGLPARTRDAIARLALDDLLTEPAGGCRLLHGDLWGGNLLCTDADEGYLIDPAVYYGHPEVDLAMTRLFGGFSARFYDAYQEVAGRFDQGLDDRLAILNLYPLLVHVHLFGGSYLAQVEGIHRRYGRA